MMKVFSVSYIPKNIQYKCQSVQKVTRNLYAYTFNNYIFLINCIINIIQFNLIYIIKANKVTIEKKIQRDYTSLYFI